MILSEARAAAWKYACIAAAVLAVAAVLSAFWFRGSAATARGARAAAIGERDAARSQVAELQGVIATERRKAERLAEIATEYEVRKDEIETEAARTVADLRAGNLRLRQRWQGCQVQLPGAAASPGDADGQDGLRAEDIGRVLGWVKTLQAQRDGLQAVTQSDRRQ